MSFATDFFKKLFSSPGVDNATPSTPVRRKTRKTPNTKQTPGSSTDGRGNHPNDGTTESTNENNSDSAPLIGSQSPALTMELSIQEQLEEEESEEAMGDEDRHRSSSPSPPLRSKGKQRAFGQGNPVRQPLGDLDLDVLPSIEATTNSNTAPSPGSSIPDDGSWDDAPNRRAQDYILEAQRSRGDAAYLIQRSIREPEYSLRDVEIRDGLWQIYSQMEDFSRVHFAFDLQKNAHHVALENMFGSMSRETVKIIGCVASGGPEGDDGWRSLFYDQEKRHALVCAILGNVISEQVLQHIFFGGAPEDIETVAILQERHRDADGFTRTERYADAMQGIIAAPDEPPHLPSNFANHTNYINAAIWKHLRPIYRLQATNVVPRSLISSLHTIVIQAGMLSLLMRLDEHTAYTFMPVFKEVYFSPTRQECYNAESLEATPTEGDMVNQIVIMPSVTAFRRGGWEISTSTLAAPDFMDDCENTGIRERQITHGWVFCRRGIPRAVGRSTEEGFVEFFPGVQGVPNPRMEGSKAKVDRKGKGKA